MLTERQGNLFHRDSHNPSFEAIKASMLTAVTPIDFCVPVNRPFPPQSLLQELQESLADIVKYYPDYAQAHQESLATLTGVPAQNIVVANGSTELITLLTRDCSTPIATCTPTFGRWTDLPRELGKTTHFIQRHHCDAFQLSVERIISEVREHGVRTLVLSNPNNPTGAIVSGEDIARLCNELADLDLIILDESFIDFSTATSAASIAITADNVVVVKSLGKSLGWHGVRLGYAVTSAPRATQLRRSTPWWNINGVAAFVLKRVAHLDQELQRSFEKVRDDRHYMAAELKRIKGLKVFESHANFIFAQLPDTHSGKSVRDTLLSHYHLLVRECSNKVGSTEQYLRLAVNLPVETDRLVFALQEILQAPQQDRAD